MGITKRKEFSKETNRMSEVLRVLGHPARLELILCVKNNPNMTCMALVKHLPLAQSTVSKHLSELKNYQIVNTVQEGKSIFYTLNTELLLEVQKYLGLFFDEGAQQKTNKATGRKNKRSQKLKKENYVFRHLRIEKKQE